jgi:hypothetical protein
VVVNVAHVRREFICYGCQKPGHKIAHCPDRKRLYVYGKKHAVALMVTAFALSTAVSPPSKNVIWFDTGASHHILCDERWLHEVVECGTRWG